MVPKTYGMEEGLQLSEGVQIWINAYLLPDTKSGLVRTMYVKPMQVKEMQDLTIQKKVFTYVKSAYSHSLVC
jgi:hypothetical protein